MSILIVDDSEASRRILQVILNQAGYNETILVESAIEAIKILNNEQNLSPVDMILMDVMMDEMSGIEATELIKKSDSLKDIPIIMVSSVSDEKRIEKAFAAGAIDYINKPIKKIELLARVRSVLRLKQEMDKRKKREKQLEMLNKSLKKANESLLKLTRMDGLTGIFNRRYFDEAIKKELRRAIREKQSISLIMTDIDHFKLYNDHYGHLKGDDCLVNVAKTLDKIVKRPADVVARYGGEEFVILLPNTDWKGAYKIAEDIRFNIRKLMIDHKYSEVDSFITISLGLSSIIPKRSLDYNILINAADKALYKAKNGGRDQIQLESPF